MKWIPVSERQPERGGWYAVVRRGRGDKRFPDVCQWSPPINASDGYWVGGKGPIRSVEQWLELEEELLNKEGGTGSQ